LFCVRVLFYGASALGVAIVSSPEALRVALASAASTLFEATPFLFAGVFLTRALRRDDLVAYLGCGCSTGPSARSLPATAATWIVFGPPIAIGRYLAALLASRLLRRAARSDPCGGAAHILDELATVLPAALLAAAALQGFERFDPLRLPPVGRAAAGALLGFTAAPCGLGAVALAGALRVRAPLCAAAFLCVAGIFDLRALCARHVRRRIAHDALAYAMLAAALGIVAWRHGDALVHPALAGVLGACAVASSLCTIVYRRAIAPNARVAPALMLLGALVAAPPPAYHATETTLTDLFAGERVTFVGTLAIQARASALVRYAITCCRADAAPTALRLDRTPPYPAGSWLRADGTIESVNGDLRLVAHALRRVAPPTDPFVYR
jgi:hypothetical protein